MELVLVRSLWGLEDRPEHHAAALPAVAAAGYDGVTCPVQTLPADGAFADALAATGLAYLPQAITFGRTVDDHVDSLGGSVHRREGPPAD